jgi:hypothetical protein
MTACFMTILNQFNSSFSSSSSAKKQFDLWHTLSISEVAKKFKVDLLAAMISGYIGHLK